MGVNVPPEQSWTGRFAAAAVRQGLPVPPTTFYNLGVRRQPSVKIAQRWEAEYRCRLVAETEPYQIFCFGTVDMAAPQGTPVLALEDSVACARTLLTKAAKASPVLFMTAPPVANTAHTARIGTLMQAYRDMCRDIKVPFLDIFTALQQSTPYLQDLHDGIHPSELGNGLIADMLLKHPVIRGWLTPAA